MMRWLHNLLLPPRRDYSLIALLAISFCVDFLYDRDAILFLGAAFAVAPTVWSAARSLVRLRITIDTFNACAVIIAFMLADVRSAGFIALMLVCARLLDWRTESRTRDAVEELMRLKPLTAVVERDGTPVEVSADTVKTNDIVIVKSGGRIPVDGIIVHGQAYINEATVTGESVPVEKVAGDGVVSATLVESGALKVRATAVGSDSTLERMAALMREASLHKSHSEKLADQFAMMFLPFVAVLGIVTYILTRNLAMTAALFLVACADDMAVAIPLAMTASLGRAAQRGVIIKGGEWLQVMGRMRTLVLDKTGTLTYGALSVRAVHIADGVDEQRFWHALGVAEKFSEHPVGRAAYHEAVRHVGQSPDPDTFHLHKGSGVRVRFHGEDIIAGTERIFEELGLPHPPPSPEDAGTIFWVASNNVILGSVEVADTPRPEAAESLRQLRALGVNRILMFTGDNQRVASDVAHMLGIDEYRAGMTPEAKLKALEELLHDGPVGMVGDGVNDAPVLARADVGIAMGGGGAAVSVQAADVIMMTDNLSRLPEMVELGRRTYSVVRGDVVIWVLSNIIGFVLVFTGIAGPARAAFYNFVTDFFPLINSSRLFRGGKR